MIEFNNVSKVYDDSGTKALSDVSLKIEKGEFVFVVGSSGAGKSTFLKLIMREEVPTQGSIIINDYNLNKMKKRAIPYFRRTLGVVFQDFRLIPTMNVYDNVAFAMRVIGTRENEIRKRVPYVLGLVGLTSKAKSLPSKLSGGEQQRVALARALANNASLIIADEPTGNIDPQMSYEIVDLLNHINSEGTTIVMVTHEHSLVRQFKKRIIKIEHGMIVADADDLSILTDTPDEIAEKPERHGTYYQDPNNDLDFEILMKTYGVKSDSDDAKGEAQDSALQDNADAYTPADISVGTIAEESPAEDNSAAADKAPEQATEKEIIDSTEAGDAIPAEDDEAGKAGDAQ